MADALQTSGMNGLHVDIAAWYPYDTRNTSGPPMGFKQLIRIDNGGHHPDCHVMDSTDAPYTVADAPQWVAACKLPQPTVYCNLSEVMALFSYMHGAGRHWYLWVADWDDDTTKPSMPPLPSNCTLIGWQYRPVGPYDLSIISDDAWYPIGGERVITLPGVPGEWLTAHQLFAVDGTQVVVGVGTTGLVYMTRKPAGQGWSTPVVV
jgi:hypothetical protein